VNLVSIESADEASSFADTPDWYAFGLSKAYQILGQPENAIRVIDSLVEVSPSLNSLRAELYWQTGKEDEAVAIWHELVQILETEIRAAWLLGTYYFDQGNDADLEEVLAASPALRESWLGALFRARQALRSGDVATARTIYQGVVDQSDEALLFLLKDSFARREFEEARGYNDALREKYPNEPEFLVNEQKIVAALE